MWLATGVTTYRCFELIQIPVDLGDFERSWRRENPAGLAQKWGFWASNIAIFLGKMIRKPWALGLIDGYPIFGHIVVSASEKSQEWDSRHIGLLRSLGSPWIPLDPLGLHPPNGRPSFSSRDFNASLSKCLGRFFRTNVVLTKGHCAETHPVVSFINPEESL
jgi:hypothetical protein